MESRALTVPGVTVVRLGVRRAGRGGQGKEAQLDAEFGICCLVGAPGFELQRPGAGL